MLGSIFDHSTYSQLLRSYVHCFDSQYKCRGTVCPLHGFAVSEAVCLYHEFYRHETCVEWYGSDKPMKETPRRRIAVTSSLNESWEIEWWWGGGGTLHHPPPAPTPFYSYLDIYFLKPNSWMYNCIGVSGHNRESSPTWGFRKRLREFEEIEISSKAVKVTLKYKEENYN